MPVSGARTYVLKLALQPSNPSFGLNNIRGDDYSYA